MAKATFSRSLLPPADLPVLQNVLITPEDARRVLKSLDGTKQFRDPTQERVRLYMDELANEEWRQTAEPIKFAPDGSLIDGLHRLHAIVQSGCPMETVAAYNVSNEAIPRVDTGRPRTSAQFLHWLGVEDSTEVASVLRFVLGYIRHIGGSKTPVGAKCGIVTPVRIRTAHEEHPAVGASVRKLRGLRGARTVPQSIGAFVHYMGSRSSPEKADEFARLLADKAGYERGHPVHSLLRAVEEHRRGRKTPDRVAVCWMTATAWQAFEVNSNRVRLMWSPEARFPRFLCDEVDAKAKAV